MTRQYTLAIIKPDVFLRSSIIADNIIKLIKDAGFKIVVQKELQLSLSQGEEFYSDHRGKFFYQRLVSSITSDKVLPLVLFKKDEDAITQWRSLMGPTHAVKARQEFPASIRGLYGVSDTRNCVHGSDSSDTAAREIKFFFPELSLPV
eukprot:TRINITY_DN29_c1_g1_i2.p1 TRINITY_DN29_c1_g1~~TRINITY_DN29_c1_g1_i2.p1  ORF type:complete len:148 (-),score=24.92 TRINITY_DN29_c1_g1_i2:48-491(-)